MMGCHDDFQNLNAFLIVLMSTKPRSRGLAIEIHTLISSWVGLGFAVI